MGKAALVVTDMINDFIDPEGALSVGQAGRAIIPFIAYKVEETRSGGGVVIFACDAHDPADREFQQFKPHAVKNSWGSGIIAEIPYLAGDYRVDKTRYSALHNTNLEDILIREKVRRVELVGVCTSICIMFTAVSLLDREFHCRVYRDGVADFDPQAHLFALSHLQKLGVEVV
jgi:nicotinamidase/pyrazinamidase|uniref:Cysteine hydrolase n=1 Tax=Desulfobacca acetoxidans TaxID=60893 RepID=A0A7V6A2L2_9BACT